VRTQVRCVTFDIDDTLYLERDYVASGFAVVGECLRQVRQVDGFAAAAMAQFELGVRGHVFNRALQLLGVPDEPGLIDSMVRGYRAHQPSIGLLADAEAVLNKLKGGFSLAVVSDGPAASQRAKVAALRLDTWCNPIVLTDLLGSGFGKPHPKGFETVQGSTGCRGQHCVYVADNPGKDFGGPKRLGWRTVRVRRVGGLHAGSPSGPDVDVELLDLSSLPMILEGI
jgi:putative hydrolase of the HAD superfamily